MKLLTIRCENKKQVDEIRDLINKAIGKDRIYQREILKEALQLLIETRDTRLESGTSLTRWREHYNLDKY